MVLRLLHGQITLLLSILVLFISFPNPINAAFPKKLDEIIAVPQVPDTEMKCGECPCVNPCSQQSKPPPPPPPPPPKSIYCNPLAPPPPRFVYVTGVPGQGQGQGQGQPYRTDGDEWRFYSAAERNLVMRLWSLLGYGVLGLLMTW
ncbi:hypothetical protein SLEP1_g54035 [Rubroshorea leprosula]|uniref:Uncharacterized protein n=1 Tax=Rubroshorea leprosula TaxID=152421 RepID=A0AAV5MB55_9ROSI|nr:hypothetical protein SLEP1_g54035 [Rubroshorea leprosula]